MTPASETAVLDRILDRLQREPRVGPRARRLVLAFDRGDLLLEGEVDSVAAKKLALELAAAELGPGAIIDRLRVSAAQRVSDAELLVRVAKAIAAEPGLDHCALRVHRGLRTQVLRPNSVQTRGEIELRVDNGVITLDGDVPSLVDKRLAESLAWWVPGTRDVVNGLGVSPEEEDSDESIDRALGVVLARDPSLRGSHVEPHTHGRVVTLQGEVASEEQRRKAEDDAWCIFGVDKVVNDLHVGAAHPQVESP